MDLTPAVVLATWAAGTAAGAAVVAWWRIVGPGYMWVTGAVVAGFGVFVVAVGGGAAAVVGTLAGGAGAVVGRRPAVATAAMSLAAAAFAVAAARASPWLSVLTGGLLAGGVTSEMLLGHWYLVDPRLPRWALKALTAAAAAGVVAEALVVVFRVVGEGSAADPVFGWAYVALAVMTALLIAGVWRSLDEPRYTGVMAATGLGYLAVLTSLGVLVVGRIVAYG